MSDGHDQEHDGAADAHHDHGFDGEPAKELGPGEPQTPAWVPALGGALFVALAIFGIVESNAGTESGAAPDGSAKPGAAQTVAQPVPVPSAPQNPRMANAAQPQPQGQPQPAGSGQPTVTKLSPAQLEEFTKRLQEARKKVGEGAQ